MLLDLSIVYLMYTGKIDFYIGKSMVKYCYITILMISIIEIFQFQNIFTGIGSRQFKIKLVPIILTLVLGGISIYTQDTFKHTELNKELKESKGSNIDIKSLYEHELDYKSSEVDNNKKEVLVINEANPMLLDDIRVNPRKYIGRNLEISGFVCKESYLNKNQFIIGRIVMTCCAADSKVVGIIGEYDKSYDLHENEKIIVRGTIGSSIIKDDNNISHTIPVIIIEHLDVEE
jgi:putative membrane protein